MIAEEGVAAVAVEALARRLGVTKGSFYWHFKNREALLQAALKRWETDDDRQLEKHLATPASSRANGWMRCSAGCPAKPRHTAFMLRCCRRSTTRWSSP